ncbi:MAG TPA: hypothetical protein VFP17_09910 [Solirubrobacterales bacterium]|nr:hypothetical protein [Solirubrobacterales bacterium]
MSSEQSNPKRKGPRDEEARLRRVREDTRRPLAVNLVEGLALSEFVSTLPERERMSETEVLEAFRAAQRSSERED